MLRFTKAGLQQSSPECSSSSTRRLRSRELTRPTSSAPEHQPRICSARAADVTSTYTAYFGTCTASGVGKPVALWLPAFPRSSAVQLPKNKGKRARLKANHAPFSPLHFRSPSRAPCPEPEKQARKPVPWGSGVDTLVPMLKKSSIGTKTRHAEAKTKCAVPRCCVSKPSTRNLHPSKPVSFREADRVTPPNPRKGWGGMSRRTPRRERHAAEQEPPHEEQ